MRLFPPELEIGENEGFAPEKDVFARKDFGDGLGNLFANVTDPMVVVLDAPWGSGKTTFIKMWCGHMRNLGFPVIYFDAFKNDYTDDAFLAIAGEVIALADDLGSIDDEARKGYLLKAKKIAWAAARGGFKKGLSKLFGEEGVHEVVAAATEEGTSCVLDSIDAYLMDKLEGRTKERNAFNEFGRALQVLSTELSKVMQAKTTPENADGKTKDTTPRPLIFVIDELDRCNPPFALSLLEKAKHFFSVPNVHFLLVTHMEQLENSVRYTYGMDGQAGTYLQKFYHVTLGFPSENNPHTTNVEAYLKMIFSELPEDGENGQYTSDLQKIIAIYANQENITFRTLERIATQTGIFIACTNSRYLRLTPIVATLCIMKIVAPSLYAKARSITITLDEVYNFMKYDESISIGLWSKRWWGFCVGDEKYHEDNKEEMQSLWRSFYTYSVNDRRDIVPLLCSRIDNLSFTNNKHITTQHQNE